MRAADLRLGPDKRHFVGTIMVDIPKGTDCTIRRIEGTDRYRMEIIEERKILMTDQNSKAFIPDWILEGRDEPPAEQKQLFDVLPEYQ